MWVDYSWTLLRFPRYMYSVNDKRGNVHRMTSRVIGKLGNNQVLAHDLTSELSILK